MRTVAIVASLALWGVALADTPDTSQWKCKFCSPESGATESLDGAVGYRSSGSFHFGDYTGLEDKGLLLDFGGGWRYRDPEHADHWDAVVSHAALDSRALEVSGGRQGLYRLSLSFDSVPHRVDDEGRTPFRGQGSGDLTLPAGWVPSATTGTMTSLASSLRPAWLTETRQRTALGASYDPHPSVDLRFDYRHDRVDGTKSIGGTFLTLASQLPGPVDQTTDRVGVSAGYHNELWQAVLALDSSFFRNGVDALRWQDPYPAFTPGADTGQLALAPDNSAHRLSLAWASIPGCPLQASAQVALGRMLQNAAFLPATVNPNLATALPRSSLDGRIDTLTASWRGVYDVLPSLRISADVLRDDRKNRTPSAGYTQVVMDTFTSTVRTNFPYSFTRTRWRLSAERRGTLRLGGGVEQDRRERSLAGPRDTDENVLWVRAGMRPLRGLDTRVRLERSWRHGADGFGAAPGAPAENPLLRPLYLADRHRDEARGDASFAGGWFTTSVNASYARDEYPDSRIGRTGDDQVGYGAQFGAQPLTGLALSVFAQHDQLRSDQAGSQSFAAPDWFAEIDDATSVAGVQGDWQASRGFDLGASYTLSSSNGTLSTLSGGTGQGFPELLTRWHSFQLYGTHDLRPGLALRLDLIREIYTAQDWGFDGVAPATIPNLLALGQGSRDGNVSAIVLGVRYEFGASPPPSGD